MKGTPFRWIGAPEGVLLENGLIECQRCLQLKAPTAFYLKSAKHDLHVRREKVCKTCKKGRGVHAQPSVKTPKEIPSIELAGLDGLISVFLRLKQWRDECEAVVKESNRDSFDLDRKTADKETWRGYV